MGSDHLEELVAMDVLHDEVNVLLIVVGLIILHDVWMVELVENSNFFHDAINIILELLLVENFDGNKMVWVEFVVGLEYSSKSSNSKYLSLGIDMVVLLELVDSLLLSSLVRFDLHLTTYVLLRCLLILCCRVEATHFGEFSNKKYSNLTA